LNADQFRALSECFYLRHIQLKFIPPKNRSNWKPPEGNGVGEPTETLPNGIPADGVISMTTSTESKVVLMDGNITVDKPQTAAELAWWIYICAHPEIQGAGHVAPTKFQLVNEKRVSLQIDFDATLRGFLDYSESAPLDGAKSLKYPDLPVEFRQAVEKELRLIGERYAK
jgi:hypothetical protein